MQPLPRMLREAAHEFRGNWGKRENDGPGKVVDPCHEAAGAGTVGKS